MSSRFFENKHSARITAVYLKKGQRAGFGLKIALAKERMIRKSGEEERRNFFFFLKAMVVLLVVVLSTLDSFCQKKKCLTEEENKIRPDLFLYWK